MAQRVTAVTQRHRFDQGDQRGIMMAKSIFGRSQADLRLRPVGRQPGRVGERNTRHFQIATATALQQEVAVVEMQTRVGGFGTNSPKQVVGIHRAAGITEAYPL